MEWSSLVRQIAKLLEVLTSSIGGVACLRFGAGMLVPLQGAAEGCCLRVLLLEWCVRFGAVRCRVLLEGSVLGCRCQSDVCVVERACWFRAGGAAAAAVRVLCALELASWCCCREPQQGAAAGCRCKVPLQGAGGCRVLLSKGCLHLRNLDVAAGYWCQNAVCAMKLGGWLRDVYGSVRLGVAKKYLLLSGVYASVV